MNKTRKADLGRMSKSRTRARVTWRDAIGDKLPPLKQHSRGWMRRLAAVTSFPIVIGAFASADAAAHELESLWQSRGYGTIAEIRAGDVRLIERTPVSCLPARQYSADQFLNEFQVKLDPQDTTFEIRNNGTLSTIIFERLDDGTLDRLCPEGLTPKTDDPELNFEILWHTFDQHYAFFSERNVDWDAVYAEFRPQINGGTTGSELGELLGAMLERLKDAHVGLSTNDRDVVSVDSRFSKRIREECKKQLEADCDLDHFMEDRYASIDEIVRTRYLENGFKTAFNENALWGQIGEATGYFRIDGMAGLDRDRHSSSADLAVLEPVLDAMLNDLGHLPAMIIDVRLNGGGHDAVALAIASRFADDRRLFASKRTREGGNRTSQQDLFVEPANGLRYQGQVAVLIGSETGSAAEVFTMAMRALPHVILVGTPTTGILSDEFYRSLPNGWQFSLSNEIYLAHDGELFEATGVPPDVSTPSFSHEDVHNSVDSGIEAAIAVLLD